MTHESITPRNVQPLQITASIENVAPDLLADQNGGPEFRQVRDTDRVVESWENCTTRLTLMH